MHTAPWETKERPRFALRINTGLGFNAMQILLQKCATQTMQVKQISQGGVPGAICGTYRKLVAVLETGRLLTLG